MLGKRLVILIAFSIGGLILALLLARCGHGPTREITVPATQEPTKEAIVVVNTTAKQVSISTVVTPGAEDSFGLPEDQYLLVEATERQDICYENCDCPPPTPAAGPLTPSQQEELMRNLVQEGARGFVHTTAAINMGSCACVAGWDWLEPIEQLPFTWSFANLDHPFDVTLYSADRDGTVVAEIDGVIYSFRSGDTWQARYETSPDTEPAVCPSEWKPKWTQELLFRNNGFVDLESSPSD